MQISVTISGLSRLFGDDLAAVVDVARVADEAGIHQIVMTDHLAIGPRTDRYPFAPKFPYPPEEPWLEPLTVLAAFAAATTPGAARDRRPDRPGRGPRSWSPRRWRRSTCSRAAGSTSASAPAGSARSSPTRACRSSGRTARMEDTVRACRALWEQEPPVSFTSDTVSFTDLWCEPRPVQARLPIWFSGAANDATVRRVAELGDGWLPLAIPLDDVTATIERMRAAFRDAGSGPGDARRAAGPRGEDRRRRRGGSRRDPRAGRPTSRRAGITTRVGRARAASCAAGPTSSPSCVTSARRLRVAHLSRDTVTA